MLVALSVSVAPFASSIPGVTLTPAESVFEVVIASNWAEIAGAPLTVVLPVKPAAVKVAIMSSTDLLKRSRWSAYAWADAFALIKLLLAVNSVCTLAIAALIANFNSAFVRFET